MKTKWYITISVIFFVIILIMCMGIIISTDNQTKEGYIVKHFTQGDNFYFKLCVDYPHYYWFIVVKVSASDYEYYDCGYWYPYHQSQVQ